MRAVAEIIGRARLLMADQDFYGEERERPLLFARVGREDTIGRRWVVIAEPWGEAWATPLSVN